MLDKHNNNHTDGYSFYPYRTGAIITSAICGLCGPLGVIILFSGNNINYWNTKTPIICIICFLLMSLLTIIHGYPYNIHFDSIGITHNIGKKTTSNFLWEDAVVAYNITGKNTQFLVFSVRELSLDELENLFKKRLAEDLGIAVNLSIIDINKIRPYFPENLKTENVLRFENGKCAFVSKKEYTP